MYKNVNILNKQLMIEDNPFYVLLLIKESKHIKNLNKQKFPTELLSGIAKKKTDQRK